MGLFSKDIKSLDDLFVHGLQDLYYAENQIIKALPTLIENAGNAGLKQGLKSHLAETENQVKRLEQVFRMHGRDPKGTKCPAIDGILKEGNDTIGEVADEDVRDAAMIAAAQAVEHYEITRYGALIAWATELGRNDCATMLEKNLAEEKATDAKLTIMAEQRVNPNAVGRAQKVSERKRSNGRSRRTAPKSKPAVTQRTKRKA